MSHNKLPFQALADHEAARIAAAIVGQDPATNPFVAAVRATRMPMLITDARQDDNPVVFVNDAFCRMSGYERAEILGRNCRFLQGPDTDRAALARVRAAVAGQKPIQIDLLNYRKNGEPFWNRLVIAPVLDVADQLAYFFASQVDVTRDLKRLGALERENAGLMAQLQERLQATERIAERFQLATEAGRIGIWELDVATRTYTCSQIFREIFGCAPDRAVTYADLEAATHPADWARIRSAREHALRTGEDADFQYRVVHGDGRVVWVQTVAKAEIDAQGKVLRYAGISRDITERIQAEVRTRTLLELDDILRGESNAGELAYQAAALLATALEVDRAGYGSVDMRAETINIEKDCNAPGVESLAGQLHFREYGSYIDDLKAGRTVVIADSRLDARTSGTSAALEKVHARAFINMPVRESQALVALLYLAHSEPREWSAADLDLVREVAQRTRMAVQRRQAEQDLRNLAATLEAKVSVRTQELMTVEAELRQSQKMEAVGHLTGGLAHDFNNLLAGIAGSLDLLKRRHAAGQYADFDRYIDIGQGSVKRAAALTHRLLAFSRRQTLEPKVVDLNLLVAGMQELIKRTVGPAVLVNVVSTASLWATRVDPGQLENSLLNLCINARDAMPDGGKLTIESSNHLLAAAAAQPLELAPGPYVALSVRDTGVGMSPDIAVRAFDPFFTTKPTGQGTGLGLSMVYGFARQSGGQVHIHTAPGLGTTVSIYLPRTEELHQDSDTGPAHEAERAALGSGRTVLLVDDEPALRTLISDLLQENGYRVLSAEDGPTALILLRSGEPIDLLLTDVGLPGGMNGRQVADAARELRSGLPVVFITGYAEDAALRERTVAPGMHLLVKPFDMDTLVRRIAEVLAASAPASDPALSEARKTQA